jgi:hypothetical protein
MQEMRTYEELQVDLLGPVRAWLESETADEEAAALMASADVLDRYNPDELFTVSPGPTALLGALSALQCFNYSAMAPRDIFIAEAIRSMICTAIAYTNDTEAPLGYDG